MKNLRGFRLLTEIPRGKHGEKAKGIRIHWIHLILTFIHTLMWYSYFSVFRIHLASRPFPSILNRPSSRHRFITRRIVSRLTLGQSCFTSAMPKGLNTLSSAYSTKSVLEPRAAQACSPKTHHSMCPPHGALFFWTIIGLFMASSTRPPSPD
jgi:hypothetical protein